jgi:hypothetical protein
MRPQTPSLTTEIRARLAELQTVQGRSYHPERDAPPWVEFCVEAHLAQARRRLEQIRQASARWGFLERVVERRNWPDRFVIALDKP